MKNESFVKKLKKRIPGIEVVEDDNYRWSAVHEGTLLTWRTQPRWDNKEIIEAAGFHTQGVAPPRRHGLVARPVPARSVCPHGALLSPQPAPGEAHRSLAGLWHVAVADRPSFGDQARGGESGGGPVLRLSC